MNAESGPALRRPRDAGAILRDALTWYRRHPGVFVAIGAAVVVPTFLIVRGLGLEELFSGYDATPPVSQSAIQVATSYLIVVPLVTAMATHALLAGERGELRSPGPPIGAGLESFTPVFVAVVLAAAGVMLGFLLLILPGVYLLVRWWFVPQAVVVDRQRTADALRRSGEIVRGGWWRTLGIVLLAAIAAGIPALLIQLPLTAAADAADSAALALLGDTVATTLLAPYTAIVATLLYFDLRARKEGAAIGHAAAEPASAEDGGAPPGLERPEAPLPPDRSGGPPSG